MYIIQSRGGVEPILEHMTLDLLQLKLYMLPLCCSLSFRTRNIRTRNQQQKNVHDKERPSSSTIMLFTRSNVALCLSMVLTAVSLASSTITASATCVACPSGWYGFYDAEWNKDACYKFFTEQLDWKAAEQHCVSQGAHLVSIHSLGEAEKVECLRQNKWVNIK